MSLLTIQYRFAAIKEKNPVEIKRRIIEGFKMKKAVIYSNILNRKYS
jgi:hypothetical protein